MRATYEPVTNSRARAGGSRWHHWPPPRWAIVVSIVLIALGVLLLLFDWNWFKGPVERRISAATGRAFSLGGDLDVDLGRVLRVKLSDVRLANATWAGEPQMLHLERADIHIAVAPLFRGEVSLPEVRLQRPRLWLERRPDGVANWHFEGDRPQQENRGKQPRIPRIGRLEVSDGEFVLEEPKLDTHLRIRLQSGKAPAPHATPPLDLVGSGRYREGEFELRGTIDSPLGLLDRAEPYRIDLRARAGTTAARAQGTLRSTVQLLDFDVNFLMSGEDFGDLYPLAGLALPETPPYELTGRLSRDGDVIRYRDFRGRVGDSDVTGDVSIDLGGERPALRGVFASQRLDFDDLAGMIGGTPQTGQGESASQEQRARAAERTASPTVLPDRPLNLDKLRAVDADVELRALAIEARRLPLDSMSAHLKLDDGEMVIERLRFGIAGGTLRGQVTLDAADYPITATTDVEVRNLDLRKLFPKMKQESTGKVSGMVQLAGEGNTIARLLSTADGNVDLVMGPGRISNLLVELAGLDVAEALRYALGKDKLITMRCAYARFGIDEGRMTSRALVFDTSDTAIVGEGKIDLSHERLDLELRPLPKDKSPLALRVPLQVEGTFKDPSVTPKTGPLAVRAAAAAALYALAPPAALLALIETGPGENVRCGEALAEARAPRPQDPERPQTGEDRPSPQR